MKATVDANPLCLHCNYSLQSLTEHRCPECGRAFDPNDQRTMNVTGRPVAALARRVVRGLPVWPLNVAAVLLIAWEFWLERYNVVRGPFPAEMFVTYTWVGIWIIFYLLVALPRTMQSIRRIPDALCRRPAPIRFAVFPLLGLGMWCCSQCAAPFWAAFEISRPFLDGFVQQTLNEPIRFSYPGRHIGLFDASVIEAVPWRIILQIGKGPYLLNEPVGQMPIPGGIDLGGGWYLTTTQTAWSNFDLQDDHVKLLEGFARGEYQPQRSTAELVKSLGDWLNQGEQIDYRLWLQIVPSDELPSGSFNDSLIRPDMRALVRLGKAAVPDLAAGLSGSSDMMRQRICQVVALIGRPAASAAPALGGLLNDADPLVREWAAFALGRINPQSPQVVAALVTNLSDSDPSVRFTAAQALAELHPPAWLVLPAYEKFLDGQLSAVLPSAAILGPADSRAANGWSLGNRQVLDAIESYGKDAAPLAPLLVRKYGELLPYAIEPTDGFPGPPDPNQLQWRRHDLAQYLCGGLPSFLIEMGPSAKTAAPALWDIISKHIATNTWRYVSDQWSFFVNVNALAAIAPGYPPAIRDLMTDLEERRTKFIAAYGKGVTLDNIPPEMDPALIAAAVAVLDPHSADLRAFLAQDRKMPRDSARWAWRRSITVWVDPNDLSTSWSEDEPQPKRTFNEVQWLAGVPHLPSRDNGDLQQALATGDRWGRLRAVMTLKALGVAAQPLREDLEQHALGDVDGEVRYAASLALKQIPAPAESR